MTTRSLDNSFRRRASWRAVVAVAVGVSTAVLLWRATRSREADTYELDGGISGWPEVGLPEWAAERMVGRLPWWIVGSEEYPLPVVVPSRFTPAA